MSTASQLAMRSLSPPPQKTLFICRLELLSNLLEDFVIHYNLKKKKKKTCEEGRPKANDHFLQSYV